MGKEILESMLVHGGGSMIETVALEGSTWAEMPHKFEAGTPNIAGVIGTGVAVGYLMSLDRKAALDHDIELGRYLLEKLSGFKHIKVFVKDPSD